MSRELREKSCIVKVSGVEGVDLQATAVWTSRQPPQYLQQTSLLPELRLRLAEHLFRTTREEQYKTNPLAGAGDLCVLGTVVGRVSGVVLCLVLSCVVRVLIRIG